MKLKINFNNTHQFWWVFRNCQEGEVGIGCTSASQEALSMPLRSRQAGQRIMSGAGFDSASMLRLRPSGSAQHKRPHVRPERSGAKSKGLSGGDGGSGGWATTGGCPYKGHRSAWFREGARAASAALRRTRRSTAPAAPDPSAGRWTACGRSASDASTGCFPSGPWPRPSRARSCPAPTRPPSDSLPG